MSEIFCLELSIVLWIAHVLAQAFAARSEFGDDYLMGARDETRSPKDVAVGRATRALHNYVENYAPFIAADLALIATGHAGGWGATIWILARIAYLPVYLMGIAKVRTGIWAASILGLLMMLARLMGA